MPRLPDILPSVVATPAASPRLFAGQVEQARDARPQQSIALGRAMQQAGGDLLQIGEQIQQDVDRAKVHEADALYSEAVRGALEAPGGGYLTLVGKAAVEGRSAAVEAMRKAREQMLTRLDNPVQKETFARAAAVRDQDALSAIDRHTAREAKVWRIGQARATVGVHQNDAIAYHDGTAADAEREARLRQSVDALADAMGVGPQDPQRQAMHIEAATDLHAGIVDKLVSANRPADAAAYLGKIKPGEIDATVGTKLAGLVQRASDDDEAQRIADQLDDMGGSLQDRIGLVALAFRDRKISVQVRDSAIARLRAAQNLRDDARDQQSAAALNDAIQFTTANRATVTSFEQLPPKTRQQLSDSGAEPRFRNWLAQGGKWISTDAGYDLLRLPPDRLLQFRSIDDLVAKARGDLSNEHLHELAEKWRRARGEVIKNSQPDQMTESEVGDEVRGILDKAGLTPIRVGAVKGDDLTRARETAEAFRLEQAIRDTAKRIGGAAWKSPQVIRDAAKEVFGQQIRDAAGRQRVQASMSVAELNEPGVGWDTPSGPISFADVNRKEASRIVAEESLRARGVPVTPAAVAAEIRRPIFEAEQKAKAEAEAARKAEEERIQTYGRYNGPMQQTFGSPWGR